ALTLVNVSPGASPPDYQLVYSGPRETVSGQVWGRTYTATFDGTAFGSGAVLPGQAGNAIEYQLASMVADTFGRVHFFYLSNESGAIGSPLYHVALDSDRTTFGTVAKVTNDLYFVGGIGSCGQVSEAKIAEGKIWIAAEINDDVSSTTQSLRVF